MDGKAKAIPVERVSQKERGMPAQPGKNSLCLLVVGKSKGCERTCGILERYSVFKGSFEPTLEIKPASEKTIQRSFALSALHFSAGQLIDSAHRGERNG